LAKLEDTIRNTQCKTQPQAAQRTTRVGVPVSVSACLGSLRRVWSDLQGLDCPLPLCLPVTAGFSSFTCARCPLPRPVAAGPPISQVPRHADAQRGQTCSRATSAANGFRAFACIHDLRSRLTRCVPPDVCSTGCAPGHVATGATPLPRRVTQRCELRARRVAESQR
jgi:hypothetical protein